MASILRMVGTRSWSRYVQICACYLTIQRTTLVGAFEIRFRTLVYEQLETRETLTLTPTLIPNSNGKVFESDYWHASWPLYCKLADAHLYISRPWFSGDHGILMAYFRTCALKKWGQVFTRVGLLVNLYSVSRPSKAIINHSLCFKREMLLFKFTSSLTLPS